MPDVVTLVQNLTVKKPASGPLTQPVEEAFDASPYTGFSLQIALLGQNPAATATGVDVSILTSMSKDSDDNSWQVMGTVTISGTGTGGIPEWTFMKLPDSGSTTAPLLFRYIRWRVTFLTNTTSATITITGMAHR